MRLAQVDMEQVLIFLRATNGYNIFCDVGVGSVAFVGLSVFCGSGDLDVSVLWY